MLVVFSRIFQSFRDAPPALEERASVPQAAHLIARLEHLEGQVVEQGRQLSEARRLLQQASHLARYHQPSLEREIRGLLTDLKGVDGARPGAERSGWRSRLFRKPARNAA